MALSPSLSRSPPVPRTAPSPPSPPSPPLHELEHAPEHTAIEQHHAEDVEDDDEMAYLEPGSEQTLMPPPNFKPFFTLIEDTTSGEHHHPFVHYVFADDDPAIVTAASMRSLGLDDTKYMTHEPQDEDIQQQDQEGASRDGHDLPDDSPLPLPIPGIREHYLIVDLGADGLTIVDAQSLSPEWQITDKNICAAPSFDESLPNQGYMLRIEGIKIPGKNKGKGKDQAGNDKLSEARDKNQGDVLGALDNILQQVEGGLATAAKIIRVSPAEEQDTVADIRDAVEGTDVYTTR